MQPEPSVQITPAVGSGLFFFFIVAEGDFFFLTPTVIVHFFARRRFGARDCARDLPSRSRAASSELFSDEIALFESESFGR